MVKVVFVDSDPVLVEMNRALERKSVNLPRGYLGASGIGRECKRAIWKSFHWAGGRSSNANGLKAQADGYVSEDVMAERLRLVKGVSLWTVGPDKKQFSFRKGHLGGSLDGIITGVGQHTSEYHVWENKCCNIEKFNLLQKLKVDLGEGNALEKWDPTYFAQAQVYMYNFDIEYHYMTVCSPGSRNETSCITTLNPVAGKYYSEELVKEIVTAERPPSRISNNPAWFTCKFCDFHSVCHEAKIPEKNCRTCIHSTPTMDGKWTCTLFEKDLDDNAQRIGCDNHLFNPGLMAGTQTDAGDGWIEYAHPTGTVVRNTIGGGITTSTGSRG